MIIDLILVSLFLIPGICLARWYIKKEKIESESGDLILLGIVYLISIVLWPIIVGVMYLEPYIHNKLDQINKRKSKKTTVSIEN